ncbi:5-formyltetrahydrofolate cyclo-ligase [Thalassotalea maritima]|uniref:5-formyltetrahydrofolate cyclo-ligase n=1 Tax=Thalassotalea maritima TaxID=3242416 RepID=UPI003528B717
MTLANNKQNARQQLRQQIRQKRKALSANQQQSASREIVKQLANNRHIGAAQHIAVYLANDGELDLSLFIDWCWRQGKHVYLPVIHPFAKGHLLFLHYQSTTKLQANHYGIAEPALNVTQVLPASQLDVIITPLVAFDNAGNRMGMGGGFYDRTFAAIATSKQRTQQANPPVVARIGVAHRCQQVDSIPIEAWDMPLTDTFAV